MNRRLLDAIEGATRTSRILEEASGTSRLMRQIDDLARPSRLLAEMTRNPILDEIRRTEEARRAMMAPLSALTEYQARMDVVTQAAALGLPRLSASTLASVRAIENMTRTSAALEAAMRPSRSTAHALAAQVAGITESHRRFTQMASWSADLERRMNLIDVDWALGDRLAISGLSFARLSRFSDVVRYDVPFADQTNEIVVDELGQVIEQPSEEIGDREAQYDQAGRDPALVAFPEGGYSSVVVASGFQLTFPAAPIPQPIENASGVVVMDDVHHVAMRDIENHLRALVVAQLSSVEHLWVKRRVPGAMLKKWMERQDVDRSLGHPVYEPIYYSDFGDLGQIITQNNNWPLFEPFFGGKDGVLVSISRLTPIRNTIAHGRPLSPTDILSVVAEGHRLLRAMGKIILN